MKEFLISHSSFLIFFVPLHPQTNRNMESIKSQFARKLMDIKAIKL